MSKEGQSITAQLIYSPNQNINSSGNIACN